MFFFPNLSPRMIKLLPSRVPFELCFLLSFNIEASMTTGKIFGNIFLTQYLDVTLIGIPPPPRKSSENYNLIW